MCGYGERDKIGTVSAQKESREESVPTDLIVDPRVFDGRGYSDHWSYQRETPRQKSRS